MNDGPTNEGQAEVALLSELLADPSTWAEPRADLEDAVVRAVMNAAPTRSTYSTTTGVAHTSRFRPSRVVASAVAAAALALFAIGALNGLGGTKTDFNAQLAATSLAPGAHASAAITHNRAGFRIALDAHGLPALAPGRYYEAWLKSDSGELVGIGTFSSSDGRVTLWSGVSPRDFPTVSVTIEAADNDAGSSGMRVLVGRVHAA
jgi:Anti-sigma-K factor rskA